MKALFAHGFPTPTPIDQSRHIVAMSKIEGKKMTIMFMIIKYYIGNSIIMWQTIISLVILYLINSC